MWKIMHGTRAVLSYNSPSAARRVIAQNHASEGDQAHYLTYTPYVTHIAIVPNTPTGVKQPSITF